MEASCCCGVLDSGSLSGLKARSWFLLILIFRFFVPIFKPMVWILIFSFLLDFWTRLVKFCHTQHFSKISHIFPIF